MCSQFILPGSACRRWPRRLWSSWSRPPPPSPIPAARSSRRRALCFDSPFALPIFMNAFNADAMDQSLVVLIARAGRGESGRRPVGCQSGRDCQTVPIGGELDGGRGKFADARSRRKVSWSNRTSSNCRTASAELPRRRSPVDAPLLLFLHGFPEAAFVWDEMLEHFGAATAASRRTCAASRVVGAGGAGGLPCQAPDGRYRGADRPARRRCSKRWSRTTGAARSRGTSRRCGRTAMKAPGHHQFAASGHFPARAAAQPAAAGVERLHEFPVPAGRRKAAGRKRLRAHVAVLHRHGRRRSGACRRRLAHRGVRDQYRAVWNAGLRGGCNYYRASPLRPPHGAGQIR